MDPDVFRRLLGISKNRKPKGSEEPWKPNRLDAAYGRRKQTLLTLLNALAELSEESSEELGESASHEQPIQKEDFLSRPSDEQLRADGAETFNQFQRRVNDLDKGLQHFANTARQLGSSVGILSSSFSLSGRLAQILHLFRENAADLFPQKVRRERREEQPTLPTWTDTRNKRRRAPSHVHVEDMEDPEDFPIQMELFAKDVTTFVDCLNDFPEFKDTALNSSIRSLEADLKYWSSCLKAYEGQFRYPAVQRYLHDLSAVMGEHLENISSSLSDFIALGVPMIRLGQNHSSQELLNLITVATFFSAVTATTLQFSFEMTTTPLGNAVNSLWFTSLVFSIGAAVHSFLALVWKEAMYRSPRHRVPWWVLIWMRKSPLAFMVFSVTCFSVGLVLFTYSSNQHPVTSALTVIFSGCSIVGLVIVLAWFTAERWVFTRHHGTKLLADVFRDTTSEIKSSRNMKYLTYHAGIIYQHLHDQLYRCTMTLSRFSSQTISRLKSWSDGRRLAVDSEGGLHLPFDSNHEPTRTRTWPSGVESGALLPIAEIRPVTAKSFECGEGVTAPNTVTSGAAGLQVSPKDRFVNAVRSVIKMCNSLPDRTPWWTATVSSGENEEEIREIDAQMRSKVRGPKTRFKLEAMRSTHSFVAHTSLVKHLQFSPNGKFLATASWDRTSSIFKVDDTFTLNHVLAHPQGFVGQVAWSPNGHLLLTKLTKGVKIWTEDGVCRKTISRGSNVNSITWLPGGDGFLAVEGSYVTKLNLNGYILAQYHFARMFLHDVTVTQDSVRIVCVGTLMASADGLHPSKCRAEKQIIVHNIVKDEVETRIPLLHDVHSIMLAKNDEAVLVGYEGNASPQLWRLDFVKGSVRLFLKRTYMPSLPVDLAGSTYFGGNLDELVLSASKGGDIHIWDRESASLLHHIRSPTAGGDLKCIAWNHAWHTPMLATGSHDGRVSIWTNPLAAPLESSTHSSPTLARTTPTEAALNTGCLAADSGGTASGEKHEFQDDNGPGDISLVPIRSGGSSLASQNVWCISGSAAGSVTISHRRSACQALSAPATGRPSDLPIRTYLHKVRFTAVRPSLTQLKRSLTKEDELEYGVLQMRCKRWKDPP